MESETKVKSVAEVLRELKPAFDPQGPNVVIMNGTMVLSGTVGYFLNTVWEDTMEKWKVISVKNNVIIAED